MKLPKLARTMAALFLGCCLVWAVFLLVLPWLVAAVGMLAPVAVLVLFCRWAWRVNRCSR